MTHLQKNRCLLGLAAGLLVFLAQILQGCSESSAASTGRQKVDEFLEARKSVESFTDYRKRVLNETCGGGFEHCFEGANLPGADLMPFQSWDVTGSDDDWRFAQTRREITINNRSAENITFFRSARIYHPEEKLDGRWILNPLNGPSWMLKRDGQINATSGVEILLSIRIPKTSRQGKVGLVYEDATNAFSVGFDSDKILFDKKGAGRWTSPCRVFSGAGVFSQI